MWTRTVELISSVPAVGVGLGGYEDAFTRYAGTSAVFANQKWNHAHSDPLELIAESGLVGVGIAAAGFGFYLGAALLRWGQRQDPFAATVGLGCLAGVWVVVLNSMVNFPFHIPAIALYVSVLLALGWKVLHSRPERSVEHAA